MNLLTMTKPLVLVDMDGVQVDLVAGFWAAFEKAFPDGPSRSDVDETQFKIDAQLGPEWTEQVHSITNTPGFFATLQPIEGAVKAMNEMLEEGLDVRICTAPMLSNTTCASDKFWWVDAFNGDGWARRTAIVKDKTLMRGDVLVDDKPVITGDWTPIWKHVVFDATYNQDAPSPYRMHGWANWQETLIPLLGRTAA